RTAGDDGNDRGADPVEQPLHPRQPAEADVQRGQHQHHEKRGRHERDPRQRRAEHPAPNPAEVDRELGRERARGELRKGEALLVLLRADPALLLHEVLLHVPGERDRPAEPQGTEPQEVEQDLVEQRGWISAQEYKEGLAFAQLAPGPLAAQLAIYLGWVRGRVLGATLAGIAFVAPSFLM